MHGHLHISTPALFIIAAFIAAIFYMIYRMVVGPKPEPKVVYRDGFTGISPTPTAGRTNPQFQSGPADGPWAVPVSNPYTGPQYKAYNNGNDGLLTGLVLGEMLAGNRGTETIIEREPAYTASSHDDSPSDGGGVSYDSGSSDSSSSSDSGGVDISW